jgi:hypothetical protein
MRPREKHELLKIPENLLEKILPSLQATLQELLAHKIPYRCLSAHRVEATAYLMGRMPTCSNVNPTTLSIPPTMTWVIHNIVKAVCQPPPGVEHMSICYAHIPGNCDTYLICIASHWAEI